MTDWIVEPRPLLRHQGRLAEALPWATLAINVVGSFALATIAGLALRGTIDNGNLSLTLRVGLCGGFTTMSTFSLEVVDLASRGAWLSALGYVTLTCALCVAASYAGGRGCTGIAPTAYERVQAHP